MSKPNFSYYKESTQNNWARFIIEPLPQGFGHTLGNALRRVLYSSIPGAAITSVRIEGVNHQFSNLDGLQEDIVQLILSLKQVRPILNGSDSAEISLSVKGPKEITASDIETTSSVTIANPDLILGHLVDKNSKLQFEATVESGLGYSPSEDRKTTTLGSIPLDATFSPVLRVNYSVESTRVGRITNFDKLILEVTTDGTIQPEHAIETASQILVDYFSTILNPQVTNHASESQPASNLSSQNSNISVEELDLPTRIANALQKSGLETISDLLKIPRGELAKIKNLGVKSVKIIDVALAERGFTLSQ